MPSSFTANPNTKALTTTAKWIARSVEDVTLTLSTGATWPAGSYTLALAGAEHETWASTDGSGSTALSGASGLTLSGAVNLNTTELMRAVKLSEDGKAEGTLALVNQTTGRRYVLRDHPVYDDGYDANGVPSAGGSTYYTAAAQDARYIRKAIGTTKGDLVAWGASASPQRVAVGSDGQVLVARAAATAGVRWETAAAAAVSSVFGRTGAVIARANDYSATQVIKTTVGLGNLTDAAAPGLTPHAMHSATLTGNVTSWAPTGLRNGDSAGILLRNPSYSVATTGLTGWPGYAATSMSTIAQNGAILLIQRAGATYYGVA